MFPLVPTSGCTCLASHVIDFRTTSSLCSMMMKVLRTKLLVTVGYVEFTARKSHALLSQVWILDSDLLLFLMHNFQNYIEKEKYNTFQSLSCAWSTSFRGLHIHLVRLTLATAPMTSVSDRWSDDHVGMVVIRCMSMKPCG